MHHRRLGSAEGLLESEAGEEDETGGRGLQWSGKAWLLLQPDKCYMNMCHLQSRTR